MVRAATGEHSVSALARRYPISITAIQRHVGVLESAGLMSKERRGREQIVTSEHETLVSNRKRREGSQQHLAGPALPVVRPVDERMKP